MNTLKVVQKIIAIAFLGYLLFLAGIAFNNPHHQAAKLIVYKKLKLHYTEIQWEDSQYLNKQAGTYNVYRTEDGLKIDSISKGISGKIFYDFSVKPGHSYSYLVSSTDSNGVESGFVNAANVTMPE